MVWVPITPVAPKHSPRSTHPKTSTPKCAGRQSQKSTPTPLRWSELFPPHMLLGVRERSNEHANRHSRRPAADPVPLRAARAQHAPPHKVPMTRGRSSKPSRAALGAARITHGFPESMTHPGGIDPPSLEARPIRQRRPCHRFPATPALMRWEVRRRESTHGTVRSRQHAWLILEPHAASMRPTPAPNPIVPRRTVL